MDIIYVKHENDPASQKSTVFSMGLIIALLSLFVRKLYLGTPSSDLSIDNASEAV